MGIDDRGNKFGTEDQPRTLIKEPLEVECGKFDVLFANIEAHGHMGSCPGYALLIWQGKATKPREDVCRGRVGKIVERSLAGEARMKTCKDRIAGGQRVRGKRRARIERGAVDVPEEPWDKDDEQVAVRHADAPGRLHHRETARKEKDRATSESTKEDQKQQRKNKRTNGGRRYDLSKKLRNTSASYRSIE